MTNKLYNYYLSGPMTGLPNYNYPTFNSAAEIVRSHGYIVFNPAECFEGAQDLPKEVYMHEDLRAVIDSEAVILLPDWDKSSGSIVEVEVARACGLPLISLRDFIVKERGGAMSNGGSDVAVRWSEYDDFRSRVEYETRHKISNELQKKISIVKEAELSTNLLFGLELANSIVLNLTSVELDELSQRKISSIE